MNAEILIAIGVALVLVFVVLKLGKGAGKQRREEIYKELGDVRRLSGSDSSSQKFAVIRGDTVLGKALRYAGVKGETVGELLKNARNHFGRNEYEEIWKVHKLRNTLVHERYEMSNQEAIWAVSVYTSAVKHLVK